MLSYGDNFDIISGNCGTNGTGTCSGTCTRHCSTGTPSTFHALRCAATSSGTGAGAGGVDFDILHREVSSDNFHRVSTGITTNDKLTAIVFVSYGCVSVLL